MPWSETDYNKAIDILAEKIKIFVENNKKNGREFISFLGDQKTLGTHQDMVNRSGVISKENQYLKREIPRQEPYDYINKILEERKRLDIENLLKSKKSENKKTIKLKK